MDLYHHLALGLSVALTTQNLLFALLGVLLGTLIGILPGLGPVAIVAMLLPVVNTLDATPALIMLAGIYYGAQYGASTTAILLNLPGETSSIVAAIDGNQMARQGRAGAAVGVAVLGSFFAGCVGTVIIALIAPTLTGLAFEFGPAEYFSLMTLGLVSAVVFAPGPLLKSIAMTILGLLLAQTNTDVISGTARYSFDVPELNDGMGFIVIAVGLFCFGEIIFNLGKPFEQRELFTQELNGIWPTKKDFQEAGPAVFRGTALGSLLGMLPGGGPLLSSFASYSLESKLAANSGRFGKGDIRGVAGPESANSAGAQTSFIPMLMLGIPPNAVMALMIGAMAVKGIQPGPQVMTSDPQLFWGLIASMWVGNVMLVILNLPLVGIWIKLLKVPYHYLYPAITLFCCIGVYSINHNNVDVFLTAFFALVGYVFHKLHCEATPLLLGFILGPKLEENLRLALLLSKGDWGTFVTNGLSAGLLTAAGCMVLLVMLPSIKNKRKEAFHDMD